MASLPRWGFACVCLLLLCLTGCVQYDVGIRFDHQHRGAITQEIALGEQFSSFTQTDTQQWLDSVKQRAKQQGGKVKTTGNNHLEVVIPFNNGAELKEKFNGFFNPQTPEKNVKSSGDRFSALQLQSSLDLQQQNWILADRNQLTLDVDLRALGLLSEQGNILVSSGSLFNLNLKLETPWGSRVLEYGGDRPGLVSQGSSLVWQLEPGQLNHLVVRFWVPSPVAIGGLGIIFLVVLVQWFAQKVRPPVPSPDPEPQS